MERTRPSNKVEVGACRCPGAPHSNDWVELHPQVTIPIGTAVYAAVRAAGEDSQLMQGLMARSYVLLGIRRWSFTDLDREVIPVTPGHVGWSELVDHLLPWNNGGMEVANLADALYSDDVLRPLTSRPSTQSPGGQMDGSTLATRPTSPRRRKRCTPSSQSGSAAGKQSAGRDP